MCECMCLGDDCDSGAAEQTKPGSGQQELLEPAGRRALAEKFNAEIAVEIDVCSKCWKRDPSLCLFREHFLMLRLMVPSS